MKPNYHQLSWPDVLNAKFRERSDTSCHLDLSSAKVHQLFANYLSHGHAWYRIFYTHQLHKMIDDFIKRREHHPHLSSTASCSYEGQPTLLLGPLLGDITVLLIMAIGEMCLNTTSLLTPRSRWPKDSRQSQFDHGLRNEVPGSTSSVPHGLESSFASVQYTTEFNTRSTTNTNDRGSGRPRSHEIEFAAEIIHRSAVPDSGYYQEAIRLLEGQSCRHELSFAHVNLLKGLYQAQCARVVESKECFKTAGNKLYDLIIHHKLLIDDSDGHSSGVTRMQLIPEQQLLEGELKGPALMSAWCCLQLETDAHGRSYPGSSSLHLIKGILPLPPVPLEVESLREFSSYDYLALAFADRQLRLFRDELYGCNGLRLSFDEVQQSLFRHKRILLQWRATLPPDLKWRDGDRVASTVIGAQIRAKYYQMMYRIHLPFLDYALNIRPHLGRCQTVKEIAVNGHPANRDAADIRLLEAIDEMGANEIQGACYECITAATQIMTVFDGVFQYSTIPNICDIASA